MSLHARLRAETRDAHERIEAAFDLAASLVSRQSYGDLLARLLAFHEAFEEAAEPHLAGTGLARTERRSALLRADLAALGGPAGPARAVRLSFAGRPEAIGAAYVVEGSSLGGVLIAREVERRLGLGPEAGNAFFAGDGRDTARNWRAFCAALDSCADPATDDRVLQAAEEAYASLHLHLAGPGVGAA